MKSQILILVATLAWSAAAQTNTPTLRTNWVDVTPHLRYVNGQLHDTRNAKWLNYSGNYRGTTGGLVTIQMDLLKMTYHSVPGSVPTHNYWGGVTGYRPAMVDEGRFTTVPGGGSKAIIYNFPANRRLMAGSRLTVRAIEIGKTRDGVRLLDCGRPRLVPVVTVEAAK